MEMKVDTSSVLMSETLRGNVPELEGEGGPAQPQHVIVIAEKITGGGTKHEQVVGILRAVQFDAEPQIEFRLALEEAMGIVQASGLSFGKFELHLGERIIELPGPFVVRTARIDEIDNVHQLCTLSLVLQKRAR